MILRSHSQADVAEWQLERWSNWRNRARPREGAADARRDEERPIDVGEASDDVTRAAGDARPGWCACWGRGWWEATTEFRPGEVALASVASTKFIRHPARQSVQEIG
jgi:hypothetical protein